MARGAPKELTKAAAGDDRPTAPAGRRRGPRKGDLKEAAIVETAWRLLGEKPLQDISIEDLATGAGIHRSTFYFYFDSRDAVIRALAQRTIEELRRATVDTVDATGTPVETIRLMVVGLLERWRQQGTMLRAMATMYERDAELRAFWDDVNDDLLRTLAALIDQERDAGHALPGPPGSLELLRALSAMVWRSGYEFSLSGRKTLPDDLVDTLVQICLRAIYGAA